RELEHRVGVIPFPTLRTSQSGSITGGYTIGSAVSSNLTEEQKEVAIGLLREIYKVEVQSRIVSEGQRLPYMAIPIDPEETGPVFAQVYELMEKAASTFIAYDNVLSPEVNRTLLTVVDRVLNLRMSPYEALQELEEASIAYWKLRDSR